MLKEKLPETDEIFFNNSLRPSFFIKSQFLLPFQVLSFMKFKVSKNCATLQLIKSGMQATKHGGSCFLYIVKERFKE